MSINLYQTARRRIPEDSNIPSHHLKNLISQTETEGVWEHAAEEN
jgi:hypothetical protein